MGGNIGRSFNFVYTCQLEGELGGFGVVFINVALHIFLFLLLWVKVFILDVWKVFAKLG